MSDTEDRTNAKRLEHVNTGLRKFLRDHGYAFQFSVLRLATSTFQNEDSEWEPEASELPVSVNGNDTRIDFVLTQKGDNYMAYMVAECKRVDVGKANWCFMPAPFVGKKTRGVKKVFECIAWIPEVDDESPCGVSSRCVAQGVSTGTAESPFHLARSIGDPGGNRNVIDEACGQLLRGISGIAAMIGSDSALLGGSNQAILIPVLFTTASLWSSSVDLSTASLEDGSPSQADLELKSERWVLYQCPMSPSLKHSLPQFKQTGEMHRKLEYDLTRSIYVVNASHTRAFLQSVYVERPRVPAEWPDGRRSS